MTVCSVTGVVASAIGGTIKTRDIAPNKSIMGKQRGSIHEILNRKFYKKMRDNTDQDNGGTFLPLVFSSGGTMQQKTVKLIDQVRRECPREVNQLKFELSCALAKFRARSFLKSYLANPRPAKEKQD